MSLLTENGSQSLTRGWVLSIHKRMGYIKRKATTKKNTQLSNEKFQRMRCKYLHEISEMVSQHNIPEELVLTWDQTRLNLVPVGNWTMAKEGEKGVKIVGQDDKRMNTAMFTSTLSGEFLPFQIQSIHWEN